MGALALFVAASQSALSDEGKIVLQELIEEARQGELTEEQLATLIPEDYMTYINALAVEMARLSDLIKEKKYKRKEHSKQLLRVSLNMYSIFSLIRIDEPEKFIQARSETQTNLVRSQCMVIDANVDGEPFIRSNDLLLGELNDLGILEHFNSKDMTLCF